MKMTEAQRATLLEMCRYNDMGLLYFFRVATCRWLVAMRLAEPGSKRAHLKRPGFTLTDAGRQTLNQKDKSDE